MSYCDASARTGLDGRMTSTTRLGADFAAQIGRCNRSNSTRPASARRLSADRTAYGADHIYHSPTAGSCGGPKPSVELSITAAGKLVVLASTPLVVRGAASAIGTVSAFVFPYCYIGSLGNTTCGSALAGPIFLWHWHFLLGHLTGTEVESEKSSRDSEGRLGVQPVRGGAARRALIDYRCRL